MDSILKLAAYADRYARILRAMSLEEAKALLGFRPGENPSKSEVQKAYRTRAIENHPDRGGDPEKMVEVNVAKDILDGKVNPRKTPSRKDPAPKREDSEAVARKRQEIKNNLNIGLIERDSDKARRAMAMALSSVRAVGGSTERADLKEFLTEEFANVIDHIHDEAEGGPKHPDMDKAAKLAQNLASSSLRLGSKFASLKKAYEHLKSEPTVEKVSAHYKEVDKFVAAFHAYRTESGKLMSLISTSEHVPFSWDELYSYSHQRVIAYDGDFQRFQDNTLIELETTVEMAVDSVVMRLEREYRIVDKFPDWRKWRIPEDFWDAIDLVRKTK